MDLSKAFKEMKTDLLNKGMALKCYRLYDTGI